MCKVTTANVQWSPSNVDSLETWWIVLYREVSSFQEWIYIKKNTEEAWAVQHYRIASKTLSPHSWNSLYKQVPSPLLRAIVQIATLIAYTAKPEWGWEMFASLTEKSRVFRCHECFSCIGKCLISCQTNYCCIFFCRLAIWEGGEVTGRRYPSTY